MVLLRLINSVSIHTISKLGGTSREPLSKRVQAFRLNNNNKNNNNKNNNKNNNERE